jgi:aryl-alcohol dehydrogenase-like predicted oxidoreductase
MTKLESRALGTQGLVVSALGLGCVGMSELYGPRELDESRATIERALDLGVSFFDTSDLYGDGHNESFLGESLGGRRNEAVIASKFGALRNDDGMSYRVDGSRGHVVRACDASLERLGTDVIDLYYQHRVDPATPIEETVGAMAGLVRAGKVRFLGLSECSAETLRRAHSVHPISAVQIEYSLFAREPEDDLIPACRELGIGIVAYSPLGRGILTGAITDTETLTAFDYRRFDPRYRGEHLTRNLELVRALEAFAHEKGCTAGQIALAWLLHAGPDVVPIPGTKRRRYLEENTASAQVVLSAEDVQELDVLVPRERVSGERYARSELERVGL